MEEEALVKYQEKTGRTVEKIGFTERDDCKWIASSPDGLIKSGNKYIGAVEIKCLSSANHVKAFIEQEIPQEYIPQGLQYFCVNDDLEYVDFVFYDDRISDIQLHVIQMNRKDYQELITVALQKQKEFIERIETALRKIIIK